MYMYILAFSCSGYTLIYLPPPPPPPVIDDELTWEPQIDYLITKLNSCIVTIKRIRPFIPKGEYLKNLQCTLSLTSYLWYKLLGWSTKLQTKQSICHPEKVC